PNLALSWFEWVLACAVMAKFWMATFSWRRIASARVRKYMLIWSGGTFVLIALALLIWARGTLVLLLIQLGFLPMDVYRVKYLLILIALLTIPVARLGLAPLSLARNRHR